MLAERGEGEQMFCRSGGGQCEPAAAAASHIMQSGLLYGCSSSG